MSKLRKMKNNPNKGIEGNSHIARSLQELGAARSIVATADGEVIAGNHVLEQAERLGIPTRIVKTDGSELVVVQRTDVESGSDKAMAIAIADNRTSELSLQWDNEVLQQYSDLPQVEWLFPSDFELPEEEMQKINEKKEINKFILTIIFKSEKDRNDAVILLNKNFKCKIS